MYLYTFDVDYTRERRDGKFIRSGARVSRTRCATWMQLERLLARESSTTKSVIIHSITITRSKV